MEWQLKVERGLNMKVEQCPICKTALKNTESGTTKCIACNAVISSDVNLDSKFGYEWTKELEDLQDAQS